jgi:hypothetical protein
MSMQLPKPASRLVVKFCGFRFSVDQAGCTRGNRVAGGVQRETQCLEPDIVGIKERAGGLNFGCSSFFSHG